MKIMTVLGTRPEIIKLSPLIPLLDKEFNHVLVHTGQHYDYEMDSLFFEELGLKKPNFNLKVGSGLQGKQTGLMIEKLERLMLDEKPDLVIVFGDTNTTLAGSLAASKLNIKLAHIEAGCRSFNMQMPEEKNRIIADHISDYLFVLYEEDQENLLRERIKKENIYLVGSLLADACLRNRELVKNSDIIEKLNLKKEGYILATMHREENTNNLKNLKGIFNAFNELSLLMDIVLPLHPRTRKLLDENNIKVSKSIKITRPVGYVDFLNLLINSRFIMTDSGGIQEEAVLLNKPCLVLRNETEVMRYVKAGKLILTGNSSGNIISKSKELIENKDKLKKIISIKVDFRKDVSKRILDILMGLFNAKK